MKRTLVAVIFGSLILFAVPSAFALSSRVIPAKACILLTADESVVYEKNASQKLQPASTVKLMTAMVALDRLQPDAKYSVTSYVAATPSSRPRLRVGDELTVQDLLHMALMKSVNAAAVALAEAAAGSEEAFVDLMNQKADQIGACDTHFENASGLPTREKQFTTARDLTIILKNALTYPLIREIIGKKQTVVTTTAGKELYIANTDALLWYRNDMVGGKTGFTNGARHCFVGAIETENGLVYTAVLGAPSRRRLWTSTQILAGLSAKPDEASLVKTDENATDPGAKKHRTKKHRRAKKKVRRVAA